MAVSLVLGLGLEHSCAWPRKGLSSERLSLASDFCVSLALASSVVSSTPPLLLTSVKVFIVNILHHSVIVSVQTSLHW